MANQTLEVTGNVRLIVEAEGLEAKLVFDRDPGGLKWTETDLAALLTEKEVEKADRRALRPIIQKFASSPQKTVEVIVAKGMPATPDTCDVPEWSDCPIPPELEGVRDDVLRSAPDPRVVIVKETTVKRRKVLPKKTQFPFMAGKEETTYVYEKVRKEIPVEIDPAVLETGFVRKGAVIAELKPGEEGQSGYDVFGTIIRVPKEPVPAVYPGDGVEKRDETLVATQTGFLRRGSNWADVVPFEHHTWNLAFSRDRSSCYLSFTPGKMSEGLPRAENLIQEAVEQGYPPEALISEEEIDSLLVDSFRKGMPIESLLISRDCDADMRIDMSEEKIEARLYARKGQGRGRRLDLKALGELIRNSKIRGLDLERIRKDVLDFYRGPALELSGYVLLAGTLPGRGPDRELTFLIEPLNENLTAMYFKRFSGMTQEESGIASLNDFPVSLVGAFASVKKGVQIALLSPAVHGEAGKDIYGNTVPGLPGNDPDIRLFENLKFEKDAVIAEVDGILEKGERDGAVLLRIRKYRDATASITVTENRMRALLSIEASEGAGLPVRLEDVRRLMNEQGVVYGILEDAVAVAVKNAAEGMPVRDFPIAQGKSPHDGMENRIEFKVQLVEEKGVTLRANGSADFKNQNHITQVREGDLIAEILPPETIPEPGCDVTGKSIPARQAPPLKIQLGKNIRQENMEGGRMRLIAGATGELIYTKGLLEIQNIHIVPGDVDYKCGNIKFPGTVLVKGSVLSGFHIFAGADIMIEQVAQSALLSAEGNLFVKQGIKGGGKGVFRTKKNLAAGFVEQAVLLCVGDVRIEKSCIHSRVRCNGQVHLAQDKSRLFGGSVKARKGITVHSLGSESGVRTEVSFGQDYLVADQIETEEKEIEKLKARIAELDALMKNDERNIDRSHLEAIRKEKIELLKLVEKRGFRLFNLREKFEEHFPSEINVRGVLHPGVVLESHGRTLEIRIEKKNVCLYFNPDLGRIQEKPLREPTRK